MLPLGVSTVTWTAVDAAGNSSSATQVVTFADTTAPTLTCPAGVTGSYQFSPALGNPSVQDVVDAAPVVANNAPASFPVGVTTVTWTATDHSGNESSCTQQVTMIHGWSAQSMVTPANLPSYVTQLGSVSCMSNTSCVAVGYQLMGRVTTAESAFWDGTS